MEDLKITPNQIWTNYTSYNCRKWLGRWVRWNPATRTVINSFDSIRHIQLINDSKMRHQNTFIYEDGSSVCEGPMNGPWEYLKDRDCDEQGMIHPSSRKMGNDARAFFLANGGGAWTIMEVKSNAVFFLEIFFPDVFKRFSTGMQYDKEGNAARLTFIREDNRARPSTYWTDKTELRDGFETKTAYVGKETTLTSRLLQSVVEDCEWKQDYWLRETREGGNTVIYLPDDVMTSYPVQITPSQSFYVASCCHYTEGEQDEVREQMIYFENGRFASFKQGIYYPVKK